MNTLYRLLPRPAVAAIALLVLIALPVVPAYWLARAQQLELLQERAAAIARRLAGEAILAVYTRDLVRLGELTATRVYAEPDIAAVAYLDASGQTLLNWTPSATSADDDTDTVSLGTGLLRLPGRLVYRQPIEVASLGTEDSASPPERLGVVAVAFRDDWPATLPATLATTTGAGLLGSFLILLFVRLWTTRERQSLHRVVTGLLEPLPAPALAGSSSELARTVENIVLTQRRQITQLQGELSELRQTNNHLSAAADSLRQDDERRWLRGPACEITVDAHGHLVEANEAAARLLGTPPGMLSSPAPLALPTPEGTRVYPVSQPLATWLNATALKDPAGHVRHLSWTVREQRGDGHALLRMCTGTDITQRVALEQAITTVAAADTTDPHGLLDAVRRMCEAPWAAIALADSVACQRTLLMVLTPAAPEVIQLTLLQNLLATSLPADNLSRLPAVPELVRALLEVPDSGCFVYPVEPRPETAARALVLAGAADRPALPPHALPFLRLLGRRIALDQLRAASARELTEARDKALAASRAKSEFVANLSHEIRTPLNAISGYARLLAATPLTPEQQRHLRTIEVSSQTLLGIVTEVLDHARLESGQFRIALEPINLRDCIEETLALVIPGAHEKDIEISLLYYDDVPTEIRSDCLAIRHVLLNLLSNAIRFTPSGAVVVRVMLDDESATGTVLRVSVTDSGTGIAPEQRDRLFQPFQQLDASYTRRQGGTGLGLMIAKRVTEQLGGRIGCDSEPGRGSTFWFTIPVESLDTTVRAPVASRTWWIRDAHAPARLALRHALQSLGIHAVEFADHDPLFSTPPANSGIPDMLCVAINDAVEPDYLRELEIHASQLGAGLLVLHKGATPPVLRGTHSQALRKPVTRLGLRTVLQQAPAHASAARGLPRAERALAGLRILIADDNTLNRDLLATTLRGLGASVDEAEHGRAALARAQGRTPDVVILDVHMPEMDGITAAAALRARAETRATPVLLLTADAFLDWPSLSRTHALNGYILKPFTPEQLMQSVLRATQRGDVTETGGLALDAEAIVDDRAALAIAGGNRELVQRLRTAFRDELPGVLAELQDLDGDPERLRLAVHKLAGSATYCGASRLVGAARDIERSIKAGALPDGAVESIVRAAREFIAAI